MNKKMLQIAIYGVMALGLVIYIIVTAVTKESPGNSLPETASQTGSRTEPASQETPAYTYGTESPNPGSLPEIPEETYDTSGEKLTLKAGEDSSGRLVGACYVYIPAGFEGKSGDASVTLKPEGLDLSVTGNSPLRISWGSVPEFSRLKSEWTVADSKSGTYRVLARYKYAASESATADVYVIEHLPAPDKSDEMATYIIALDVSYNNMYPRASMTEAGLKNFLSRRYPDALSLAEAIFRPADPGKITLAEDVLGANGSDSGGQDDPDGPENAAEDAEPPAR